MKTRPVEAALFSADGRTERRLNGKTDITHLKSLVAALPRSVKPGTPVFLFKLRLDSSRERLF